MKYLLPLLLMFLTGCQSGCVSRFTGEEVTLPLPKDYQSPVGFGRTSDGKHLMYISTKGELRVKEYSDAGILQANYIFK